MVCLLMTPPEHALPIEVAERSQQQDCSCSGVSSETAEVLVAGHNPFTLGCGMQKRLHCQQMQKAVLPVLTVVSPGNQVQLQ
jgi:hypothetical protein